MKQKLLTLTNQFQNLNISIEDNKNWINLFGANYGKFLLRNKGVTIENKDQLLQILNQKPRTLLSSLRLFVKGLINYNLRLQLNTKSYSLKLRNQNTALPNYLLINNKGKTSSLSLQNSQAIKQNNVTDLTAKHPVIRARIKELTESLTQNKLALPLNVLTPLMSQINKKPVLSLNDNSASGISKTQYSKLISPFKTVNSFEQNISYNFNASNNSKLTPVFGQQQNITTLLDYAFRGMSCLISKPVYMETPKNLIINLFYFFIPGQVDMQKQSSRLTNSSSFAKAGKDKRIDAPIATSLGGIAIPSNNNQKFNKLSNSNANTAAMSQLKFNQINNFKLTNLTNMEKLNKLCLILSNIYNKPVELDLTRLNAPFFDDNILVKLIGLVSTDLKPIKIFDSIYKNANIFNKRTADYNYSYSITRSFLAGIKIKIGGRLMTQRIVPKITTRHSQRGATATGKVTYLDWSRVTLKNKRGSHSITVTISHVI